VLLIRILSLYFFLDVTSTEPGISSTSVLNQWILDSHLIMSRSSFGAVVMKNDAILVSGGYSITENGDSIDLSSCEMYSLLNRRWQTVADMQVMRNE
jgi:hypothetical protein